MAFENLKKDFLEIAKELNKIPYGEKRIIRGLPVKKSSDMWYSVDGVSPVRYIDVLCWIHFVSVDDLREFWEFIRLCELIKKSENSGVEGVCL